MRPEQVAIVVLNWNRRADTLACLESLAQAEIGGAALYVVDNGSQDGSAAAVRDAYPHVRVIALPENRGFAGGNNAGIRAALDAGAEGVLLLNNDTRVSPDFLTPMLWAFDAFPGAAAVCSAIHRMDRPEMLDVAYAQVYFAQREAVQLRGVNALPGDGFGARCEIDIAVGCSMLVKAEAWRRVGLFDEQYFAYHEDVDWSLRAHRAGYQLVYEPFSRVFHRGSGSTAALPQTPRVDSDAPADATALPNAEPMPWNPARTYLGARNLIRLLHSYATRREQLLFLLSCAYQFPLELLAILHDREGWMRLGRWSYSDALRLRLLERHADELAGRGRLQTLTWLLVHAPIDLFVTLPREIGAADRQGRLAQLRSHLRGLCDGVRGRPLPLRELGLQ